MCPSPIRTLNNLYVPWMMQTLSPVKTSSFFKEAAGFYRVLLAFEVRTISEQKYPRGLVSYLCQPIIPAFPASGISAQGVLSQDQGCPGSAILNTALSANPGRFPQGECGYSKNFHKKNLFPIKHYISEEVASPDGRRLTGISQEALLLSAPYGRSLWPLFMTSFRAAWGCLFALGNHLRTPPSHSFRSRTVASSHTVPLHYFWFSWVLNQC